MTLLVSLLLALLLASSAHAQISIGTVDQGSGGTSAWKVDGSAVTQPVSGTLTCNQGGTWNIANISGTVSLPTGAATAANQTTGNTSLSSIDGKITACNTGAVVISSGTVTVQDGGGSITVDNAGTFAVQAAQSGTWNINNVSGTVSLPTGAATAAKQPALGTAGSASADVITVQGIASMTALKVDGSGVMQPVSGTVTANQGGAPWSSNTTQLGGTAIAVNTGSASNGTQRIVIATDQPQLTNALKVDGSAVTQPVSGTVTANAGSGTFTVAGTATVTQGTAAAESAPWPTRQQRAATATLTNVSGSASSVTCLSAAATRLGATIFNDSTADLYIKHGTTASATSFTVKLGQDGLYIVPSGFTGRIDCIWASATGAARITEHTP